MSRQGTRIALRHGVAVVAIGCALAFGYLSLRIWQEHAGEPIAHIEIEGALGALERGIVEARLSRIDRGDPDIDGIKSELEALGWVDRVGVRKVWPAGLVVSITKHQAIARWGEARYLSERGRIFSSPEPLGERLPRLDGPEGSERLMMEQYHQLSKAFQQSGQAIEDVQLGARGDWLLHLRSGVIVRLGKEDISDRLLRLMRVFEEADLPERIGRIAEIDARYTNGVAVRWRGDPCTGNCYELAENDNLKRVHTL